MPRILVAFILLLLCAHAAPLSAAVQGEEVGYRPDDTSLKGYLAPPEQVAAFKQEEDLQVVNFVSFVLFVVDWNFGFLQVGILQRKSPPTRDEMADASRIAAQALSFP